MKRACVICGESGVARPIERPRESPEGAAAKVQLPYLCEQHWEDVQRDWILLGWCTDHYGEALRACGVHGREIQPV